MESTSQHHKISGRPKNWYLSHRHALTSAQTLHLSLERRRGMCSVLWMNF